MVRKSESLIWMSSKIFGLSNKPAYFLFPLNMLCRSGSSWLFNNSNLQAYLCCQCACASPSLPGNSVWYSCSAADAPYLLLWHDHLGKSVKLTQNLPELFRATAWKCETGKMAHRSSWAAAHWGSKNSFANASILHIAFKYATLFILHEQWV